MILLAHKIRLDPNNKQITYFKRACGTRRFAYNWGLSESRKLYEQGVKTSGFDLVKRFNSIKAESFPWIAEVSKWAPQKAIQDSWDALKRFWSKKAKYPRFKKRGKSRESFYLGDGHFEAKGFKLRIPKLGWVKMHQEVRFPGVVKSVTISQDGDRWFASFSIEVDESFVYPNTCENQEVVGIDLGIKTLMTLSTGEKVENPRFLREKEGNLRKLQKNLSRKVKGSSNWKKAKGLLQVTHRRVRDARRDFTHKVTSRIVKSFRFIGIEDLNVRGMLKNRRLSKALSEVVFSEIRRQIEYKAKLGSSEVAIIPRFYPSSKTCSDCGFVIEKLSLSDREWDCPSCGVIHDRDENAAMNLKIYALRHRVCGEEVRPESLLIRGLSSMKQGSSSLLTGNG